MKISTLLLVFTIIPPLVKISEVEWIDQFHWAEVLAYSVLIYLFRRIVLDAENVTDNTENAKRLE